NLFCLFRIAGDKSGQGRVPGSLPALPLPGQRVLLLAVALLARGDKVPFGGLSTAHERNQMIHRQLRGRDVMPTVVTDPIGALALPPLATAQLSRPALLALNISPADL